jgi:hypothetical protein
MIGNHISVWGWSCKIKCVECKSKVDTCKNFIWHIKMLHGDLFTEKKLNYEHLVGHRESAFQVKSSTKISTFLAHCIRLGWQGYRTKLGFPCPHFLNNWWYQDMHALTSKCAKIWCAMCLRLLTPWSRSHNGNWPTSSRKLRYDSITFDSTITIGCEK